MTDELFQRANVKMLAGYFAGREDVVMAFLFGSRAAKGGLEESDWDIACYLDSGPGVVECGAQRTYSQESEIWGDLAVILGTDNVDMVVLNSCPAEVAASAVRGEALVVKDKMLQREFMLRIASESEDFRRAADEYAQVYWRSSSLSEEDRAVLRRRLVFLDSELRDAGKYRNMKRAEYESDSSKRREVERWIENLMNGAIDVCKTILASEKQAMPSTYRQVLRGAGVLPDFSEELAERLAAWSELRNILAHEYLDMRWRRIEDFLGGAERYFGQLLEAARKRVSEAGPAREEGN